MRQADPNELEGLADLLESRDGSSGVAADVQQAFTRASGLNVRGMLSPLNPLQNWASETASDLRTSADTLRRDDVPGQMYDFFGSAKLSLTTTIFGGIGLWQAYRGRGGVPAPLGMRPTHLANHGVGRPVQGFLGRLATGFGRMPPGMARFLGGSHTAAMHMTSGSRLVTTAQQANLLRVAGGQYQLMRGWGAAGRLAGFSSAMGTVGKAAGFIRGAGVVGSAFGAVTGTADLISRGNPVDAFRDDPSGYTVAATGTAFNVSLTAALVAPNPVTVGAAVVTGVAYTGALVWDNWDTLTNPQTYRDVGNAIGDTARSAGSAVVNGLKKLNPF